MDECFRVIGAWPVAFGALLAVWNGLLLSPVQLSVVPVRLLLVFKRLFVVAADFEAFRCRSNRII